MSTAAWVSCAALVVAIVWIFVATWALDQRDADRRRLATRRPVNPWTDRDDVTEDD